MIRVNRKKIAIISLLFLIIVIELLALGLSSAEKTKEINMKIIDSQGKLEDFSVTINAFDGGKSGYYITLPERVNSILVKNYLISKKEIITDEETVENITTENLVESYNIEEDVNVDNNNTQNTTNTTEEILQIVKMQAGDRVYLTKEELENTEITIKVEYDLKEIAEETLYNNRISLEAEKEIKLEIQGYLPTTVKIKNKEINEEIGALISKEINQSEVTIVDVYNLELLKDEKAYEITDENSIQIILSKLDATKKYKIYKWTNNKVQEITEITKLENTISFMNSKLEPIIVCTKNERDTINSINLTDYLPKLLANKSLFGTQALSTWDGNVSSGFKFGDGTESNPYLISTGDELAYLAGQVNAGTTYQGNYFQIAADIDINGKTWTPIGNTNNSFRGVLDGAGHTIANAVINITSENNNIETYGFFGTIGGGNSETIIKNIEFNNIKVDFNVTREINSNNYGYKIGIVAGAIYNNAGIKNVSVKNSQIIHNGTLTAIYNQSWSNTTYYAPILFVGGIAGDAVYSSTNENTSGTYNIDYCYSDVDISLNVNTDNTGWGWGSTTPILCLGQINIGGIIGRIRRQNTWPTNSLYSGTITASNSNYTNGLVGPIFGADRNTTGYNSTTNMNNIWNGDNRNSYTMNSYYNNYNVYGTTFTSSVISGNAGTNIQYRRNTNSSNIGYVQGVNKGIYTNSISSRLDTFNQSNQNVSWKYASNELALIPRISATAVETAENVYTIEIDDPYNTGTYTYTWYINGQKDDTITGNIGPTLEPNFETGYNVDVVVFDGKYYAIASYSIPRLTIDIGFNINEANDSVTAYLTGTALPYANMEDYTYQWYKIDIIGEETRIEGANSLTLTGLEDGVEYKLIATNNANSKLSAQNTFLYGQRNVIYVSYNYGNDYNDGYTPETPVRTLSTAYSKLSRTGTRNENVIVMMGNYTEYSFFNSQTSSTYAKNVTITGKYGGVDYNANWTFGTSNSSNFFRFLTADLSIMYMTLNGNRGSMYLICQGHSFTVGEQVTMNNYATANSNQGLLGNRAPAFHLFAGWYQYNRTRLPNNDCEIIIKSGSYGRIILGGTPGTSSGQGQTTSHDFMGSSRDDSFRVKIEVNIQNSTTPSNYDYDINLLTGGSACGNNYSIVTENIINGKVGRLLGGSIGDSASRPRNWNYPENTFLGEATINVMGGSIEELYGGCLGRNMSAINSNGSVNQNYTGNTCDSYYYGTVNINITGGTITGNIYGAGAGGVTGYSTESSDPYKSYGEEFDTSVNINISNGTIGGNIYGGGYGYTEYLNANVTATDGGALYGESNITITGSPTIEGSIYGAGCGYNYRSRQNLAQMTGASNIKIDGTPTIIGQVYGAGAGISGYNEMAKLLGTSNIILQANSNFEIYGGGNIAKLEGTSTININSGTHTGDIYGGGNIGILDGTSYIYINSGTQTRVFGGGNKATATETKVYIKGGTNTEVYGGGNEAEVTTTNVYIDAGNSNNVYGGGNQAAVGVPNVFLKGGQAENIYGGSNKSGNIENTNVTTTSGIATNIYGGNNQGGTVTNSHVILNGGTITDAYGGNNQGGTTENSNITAKSGNIQNIYGGGNEAETSITNIIIEDGNINNTFGGGNKAESTTTNVQMNGGYSENIFGGGNEAGVENANIELKNGISQNVFGGSNMSGDVTNSSVITTQNSSASQPVSMEATYTAETTTWQSTEYPTIAKVKITIKNNTQNTIEKWNGKLIIPESKLFTNYSSTEITEDNGIYSFNEINRHYGTNQVAAGGTFSFEIEILSMKSVDDFSVDTAFTGVDTEGTTFGGSNVKANNIYGGNNLGGVTQNPKIEINGGTIGNIYGGGNQASVPKTTVLIKTGNIQNIYGGGNQASVNNNTKVEIFGGNISNNIYGGGNEGTVIGNTDVNIKNATILGSAYAGGNGATAVVYGNANIIVQGNTIIGTEGDNVIAQRGSVFGGGNAAATGDTATNNSTSTVNIVGGTIYGNVYGGANTSVVYGYTNVKIGYDAVNNENLQKENIYVRGTVFGGGEANAAGSEEYDYSFISVTRGINMLIDGNGYTSFKTEGSIFGSGNASSTSGESYITIKNYGKIDEPLRNISIQRATTVTLDNSWIVLSGATDRTNEFDKEKFTLSRIDEFRLKNNSGIYLNCGANLLKKFTSLDANDNLATATIEEDGTTTRNVDNRLYLLEGKNLNIATNENVTAFGEVNGMTFLGLYTNANNPITSTGLYHNSFENGDEITNAGTFSKNSYVEGMHKTNHDTHKDGFYSNYNNDGYIKTDYVGVTPEEGLSYIWLVGEKMDVTTFEINLVASKYATLGTIEQPLTNFATPNTRFQIVGFSSGLNDDITLVNGNQIEAIAQDENTANTMFGLSMKTGKNGWQSNNTTNFLTESGGTYQGNSLYLSDNSTFTPTLLFCLYHSQNLSISQELGNVIIRFQAIQPIDELNNYISYIDIVINMSTELFPNDYYEAAISPGEEFDLFTTTDTKITDKSIFSTYYSLYISDFTENDLFENYKTYNRVLVSRNASEEPYIFPANTKITMLDMASNKYYYYVVTENDETSGKYMYKFKDFIEMGTQNAQYNEVEACDLYYKTEQNLVYENFIIHVDVREASFTNNALDNSLLIELQDTDNQTLIGVLGIQRGTAKYSVYKNMEATIDVSATAQDTVYLGKDINLTVTTDFLQQTLNSSIIFDTDYLTSKMGIKITFHDSYGNQLNSDSLFGIYFQYEGVNYYPRIDGSVRIKIADKVSNVLSKIKIITKNNTTLATGDYKIRVESFGSPDGIYYGLETSDLTEVDIKIINGVFGLKVTTDDNSKIIDKTTGKTMKNNNALVTVVNYSSMLTAPNIVVELQRRNYNETYSMNYETVNFTDYFSNQYEDGYKNKEYKIISAPTSENLLFLYFKENLVTGTYKLVFKLYDANTYIGEAYEYFVIK